MRLEICEPAKVILGAVEPESKPEPDLIEPQIPRIVYHGLAGRFIDLLQDATEAPREFRLAAFLTVVGALLGRRAWVPYSRPTYPNLFTLLIGETASSRKTTVMNFAFDLMGDVAEGTGEKVKHLYGLSSVEGLVEAMKDKDSPEPYRIIVVEDELKSLLRKGQQKAVGNLIPRLTELYNCGRKFEVNTKEPTSVDNPFACVVSGSTPAWFAESIGESEISGGFLNRWSMFTGKPEKLIPFPTAPDPIRWQALVSDVASVIQRAGGEYILTPAGMELFAEFYSRFRGREDQGLRAEATARTDVHAVKFALLYALLDQHSQIEVEDISRGVGLATFNLEVTSSVVGDACLSGIGVKEKKLLTLLKGGRMNIREAMRRLHLCADDMNRIMRALERVGLIDVTTETTSAGRRRVFLEVI